MRIIAAIAVVTLIAAIAQPASAGMKEDCLQNRDLDLQIGGCTAVIQSGMFADNPGNLAITYYNRGVAYNNLGEYRRAIKDYDQVLRLDPGNAKAYSNRGFAYSNLGEYRRSIKDYDQALRIDPGYAYAYNNRGIAYKNLGEYRRSIEDYDQALRSNPGLAVAYGNRGLAYKGLGEYRRAVRDYDQALRINPNLANPRANRGFAYNRLAWDLYLEGRNAQALGDVDRSLSDRPDNSATLDTRAHVLAAMGRSREALAGFERAMRIGGADRVRKYQKALARHGYYKGAIDGAYGAGTRAALAACLDAGCRVLG